MAPSKKTKASGKSTNVAQAQPQAAPLPAAPATPPEQTGATDSIHMTDEERPRFTIRLHLRARRGAVVAGANPGVVPVATSEDDDEETEEEQFESEDEEGLPLGTVNGAAAAVAETTVLDAPAPRIVPHVTGSAEFARANETAALDDADAAAPASSPGDDNDPVQDRIKQLNEAELIAVHALVTTFPTERLSATPAPRSPIVVGNVTITFVQAGADANTAPAPTASSSAGATSCSSSAGKRARDDGDDDDNAPGPNMRTSGRISKRPRVDYKKYF